MRVCFLTEMTGSGGIYKWVLPDVVPVVFDGGIGNESAVIDDDQLLLDELLGWNSSAIGDGRFLLFLVHVGLPDGGWPRTDSPVQC